jgi:protein TonB
MNNVSRIARIAFLALAFTTVPYAVGAESARVLSRVDPEFPREAQQAGAEKGIVKARMIVDGNGNVTKVEIVEANPRRLFDRSVVRALSAWKFNEGPAGRTFEQEIAFQATR